MRVIKHGDLFEIGQVTCKRCNCEMAYTRQDITVIKNVEMSDLKIINGVIRNIITCPECHATIEV